MAMIARVGYLLRGECPTLASRKRGRAMASTLIVGKYVIAKVTGRREATTIEDGAVFERDGTIVDVGSAAELRRCHQPDRVLGSPEHVVLPGLVNSHHHVGLTPFQLGSPDSPP